MPKSKSKLRSGAGGATQMPTEANITEACRRGDLAQLRRWGREGVRVKNIRAFFTAAESIQVDVVRCLVSELGVDVNQADSNHGVTALHIAATNGQLDLMQCLLGVLDADVDEEDSTGCTASFFAAEHGQLDVMRCLVREFGADINHADHGGDTALTLATSFKYAALAKWLVKSGANINHADRKGVTALMMAADGKQAALTKWLVKAGADPQAKNTQHVTAADISRAFGASPEQTAYLEAKAHCAPSGCSGAGTKKCQGCMQGRYCGLACHVAHWPDHRAECRRLGDALKNAQAEGRE
jgi:hypothetical protein